MRGKKLIPQPQLLSLPQLSHQPPQPQHHHPVLVPLVPVLPVLNVIKDQGPMSHLRLGLVMAKMTKMVKIRPKMVKMVQRAHQKALGNKPPVMAHNHVPHPSVRLGLILVVMGSLVGWIGNNFQWNNHQTMVKMTKIRHKMVKMVKIHPNMIKMIKINNPHPHLPQ